MYQVICHLFCILYAVFGILDIASCILNGLFGILDAISDRFAKISLKELNKSYEVKFFFQISQFSNYLIIDPI